MDYRAALVGCGLIGSQFSDTVDVPGVWSHAAAYAACPKTRLVAVCDPDPTQLARCADRWNVAARYSDFNAMLDQAQPEIVSVCTPDASHFQLIRAALEHSAVRAVLAEKPLALDLQQASGLVEIAAARNVVLAVNYSRRYAAGIEEARKLIHSGALGTVQAVSGFFTKGTLHNGSHWFDLVEYLVGPVQSVSATDRLHEGGGDPTLDVMLHFDGGTRAYLHGCDSCSFALFEMDIVCTEGRLRVNDSGGVLEIYRMEASPHGAGYRCLALRDKIDDGSPQALLHAVENIANCIDEGSVPICSGQDAVQALKIGLAAHRSAQTGQMVVLKDFS